MSRRQQLGQTVRTAESLKEERRLHELAAAASEAIAMLDDASFVARVRALCGAYAAYTKACQGRGWTCKPSKTVLSADYYRGEEQVVADGFRPVEPPSSDEELQAEGGGEGSSGEQEEEASEQQTQQRHGDTGGRDHNLATSASTEVRSGSWRSMVTNIHSRHLYTRPVHSKRSA